MYYIVLHVFKRAPDGANNMYFPHLQSSYMRLGRSLEGRGETRKVHLPLMKRVVVGLPLMNLCKLLIGSWQEERGRLFMRKEAGGNSLRKREDLGWERGRSEFLESEKGGGGKEKGGNSLRKREDLRCEITWRKERGGTPWEREWRNEDIPWEREKISNERLSWWSASVPLPPVLHCDNFHTVQCGAIGYWVGEWLCPRE